MNTINTPVDVGDVQAARLRVKQSPLDSIKCSNERAIVLEIIRVTKKNYGLDVQS